MVILSARLPDAAPTARPAPTLVCAVCMRPVDKEWLDDDLTTGARTHMARCHGAVTRVSTSDRAAGVAFAAEARAR